MKILVTGAKGFLGKNLIAQLENEKYADILKYDIDTDPSLIELYTKECNFVFHLAGVNRPENEEDFMETNYGFTLKLLGNLKKHNNNCPIVISSSTQAALDNPYGRSKKAGEDLVFEYGKETDAKVLIYRFPNIFGKWCRPNYNSVVATFCNNIGLDLPIKVNDPMTIMNLVYIDDVVEELINALKNKENKLSKYCCVRKVYTVKLGEIADLLKKFKENRINLNIPNMSSEFEKKLYSTYLSYLSPNELEIPLKMNRDSRGSFTEIIRTVDRGQFSVNITKPKVKKGNHWHNTKNEKFLVVSGKGLIQLRKIDTDEILNYYVNGDEMKIVDIPPGYTHNIINIGDIDLITFIWANEPFNPEKPDTYYLEV
ncbi:capsular polysaccharide biosynthesis protein CapF [Clostridium sp. HBUAS56017]|uniref:capsular polysaccharide biosynthesis protein CapF n=1 Tax=Clostridium sp. HBUAS56017 TaxID=2571128 RepID=UPI00117791ED|nr:capsular polysaccharide biosynthesis protein CapF [Clostridium sp. HBUAS56017]